MDQEKYLKERVEDQINWFNAKSQANQHWYKSLRIIEIISAAVIPFIAGFGDKIPCGIITIGFLGVVIAICAALSALNKYQENWLIYRTTCETLRHEKFLFMTKTKPYDDDESFDQFVTRVENILSKENYQWAARITKEKTPDNKTQRH